MGKLFLFFGLTFATILTINSQEISNNAIGIRLSENNGFGSEISYQSLIGYTNRLEVNLGFRNNDNGDYFKATGVFQWVWQLENRLNLYSGFGGGIGNFRGNTISKIFSFATLNIGFEYNFESPFLISLDYRPEYGFHDVYKKFNSDVAISLRYQF